MTPTERRENTENGTAIAAFAAVAVFLTLLLVLWGFGARHSAALKFRVSETQPSSTQAALLININTACADELTSLPGIGEKKAAAIVAYRETNGNFAAIEEIINVPGIGDGIFENIKDFITVGGEP